MYSFASPLATSKKKYMANHSSSSPFPSFCTVCETQLDSSGSTLYCSEECKQKDCITNSKLPSFSLLEDQPDTSACPSLGTESPARPPSPSTDMDSTRSSFTSFDLSNLSARTSNASLYSSSVLSARRKMSDAIYSTTTCSPIQSPVTMTEGFEIPEPNLLHSTTLTNTNKQNQNQNQNQASSHRISAPVLGTGSSMSGTFSPSTATPNSGHGGPLRPRRQSFYVRSGSHLYSNSHDFIDIPKRTSVSSTNSNIHSLYPESPRSINLVMPNTHADPPAPELEYEFPKIDKRNSESSASSKKLFY